MNGFDFAWLYCVPGPHLEKLSDSTGQLTDVDVQFEKFTNLSQYAVRDIEHIGAWHDRELDSVREFILRIPRPCSICEAQPCCCSPGELGYKRRVPVADILPAMFGHFSKTEELVIQFGNRDGARADVSHDRARKSTISFSHDKTQFRNGEMKHLSQCEIDDCQEALKAGRTIEELAGQRRISAESLKMLLGLNRQKPMRPKRTGDCVTAAGQVASLPDADGTGCRFHRRCLDPVSPFWSCGHE